MSGKKEEADVRKERGNSKAVLSKGDVSIPKFYLFAPFLYFPCAGMECVFLEYEISAMNIIEFVLIDLKITGLS